MPRDRFYNSKAWKNLRKAKLAADPLCEYCPPGRLTVATDVDHVKAISAGGDPLSWKNLRSACHTCHSRKTLYIERFGKDRVPVKGCDASGRPLDPKHWWNEEA
jgi:5-methylcytosine-specific restriction endonuclease McrA